MLLTLSTTHSPATDLGFLLHKNPQRPQTFSLSFGKAQVFYPEASEAKCTAALLLDVDPVGLVRRGGEGFALENYVNDRPYAASSFLSVAIAQVLGSALAGTSRERPELAEAAIPLTATLSMVPCRGGEALLRGLFEPLGYRVEATPHVLDAAFPEWGQSPYFTVTLSQTLPLHWLLSHLYVLLPVLDDSKHYFISDDEVDKLLRHGESWLASHPMKQQIVSRYLGRHRSLERAALDQLLEPDQQNADAQDDAHAKEEELVEEKISLNEHRLSSVMSALKASGATRVLDLGCSTGNLLKRLMADKSFTQVVGYDVSVRSLEIAAKRLRVDQMSEKQRSRLQLLHGSLMYRDARLAGFDAAAVVEVIEHLDAARLAAFERVIFEFARPPTIVLTTPNVEYNIKFETLAAGTFRHKDHRFEWTRAEFESWAASVADRFGYAVRSLPVGEVDEALGAATQMAIFTRHHASGGT